MKLKNFSVLFIFLFIFSISIVAAQQESIRFYPEQFSNLTIREKCRVDGFICDSSYTCVITVLSPAQELIIDNETMSGDGIYRNVLLNETQTSVNGIYEATIDCTNSTLSGSNTFFYQITPNGSKPIDEGQGLILLGSVFILILLSFFIGLMGMKSSNTTISISLLAFSFLLMIFTLGMIFNIVELSFGTFSEIVNNYSTIFVLFTVLISVGAMGLILYIIYVALNMYWKMRGLKSVFSESE